MGGRRRASSRDAPLEGGLTLLGDGDAVGEEAEGLRAPLGGKIVLDHWLVAERLGCSVGEYGVAERQSRRKRPHLQPVQGRNSLLRRESCRRRREWSIVCEARG